jgi:hypothetical protein
MFAPYCATQESTVLLGYESVVGIEPTVFGVKVLLRCNCGELLVHDAVNRNSDLAGTQS